jgi:transposase InsO family protein
MSKTRSIILSVVLEGRSQAETARRYDVSEAWVSILVRRYRTDGAAAFEPRSRRPKTSPSKVGEPTIKAIIEIRNTLSSQGLDAGPETIRWHLQQQGIDPAPSISTIRRHLIAAGLVTPEPKKRPKSSYIRFEAALPNETWQTDMCHWRLQNGAEFELLSWIDDHSRYCLGVTVHKRVNAPIVVETFHQAAKTHGYPASVLSDNGMYFTARFARGGKSGPNHIQTVLANMGIDQKHSRPHHPTTCGKVERFQQTLKKWLRARPNIYGRKQLQTQIDAFINTYNHHRPHRSLDRATPAVAYTRLPKAHRGTDPRTEHRVRKDRIDNTGKITIRHKGHLYKIGIGRAHKRRSVIALINDLHIRIIDTQTGELLRDLTLDTTRTYQPQNTEKT